MSARDGVGRVASVLLAAAAFILAAGKAAVASSPPPTTPAGTAVIAIDDVVVGREGDQCIRVPWVANDALPADRPVTLAPDARPGAIAMRLESAPVQGRLYAHDPDQPDETGPAIPRPVGGEAADPTDVGLLCYRPNLRFFHGTDSFTYALVDASGEPIGAVAQVSVRVADDEAEPVRWRVASDLTATRGDRSATVAWSGAPSSTFIVTPFRDGVPQPAATIVGELGATFSDLDNGVPYTFSVADALGLCVNTTCEPSQAAPPAVVTPAAATTVAPAVLDAPVRYGDPLTVEAAVAASSGLLPAGAPVAVDLLRDGASVAGCEAPLDPAGVGRCQVERPHAGVYAVEARWSSPSAAFEDGRGELSEVVVERAPLRVSARDVSRPVGAPNPPLEADVEGFVAGEGLGDLDGTLRCTTPAAVDSPPGSYPIACEGPSSPDYAITFAAGTLTVTAADAAVGDGGDDRDDGGGDGGGPGGSGGPGTDGAVGNGPRPGDVATVRLARTVGGRLIARERAVHIGCRLRGAPLRRCAVTLRKADGTEIGRGSASPSRPGGGAAPVLVRLRPQALRRLLANPAGLGARVEIAAAPRGAARPLRTTSPVRLLAARQTFSGPRAALFAPDSARLTAVGRRWLEVLARQAVGVRRVICSGHVASVAGPRETPFSQTLARERGAVACATMRAAGLRAPATVTAEGKRAPRASDQTAHGRALNRRATVTLIR